MQEFKSFLEALQYHPNCVICGHKMSVNDRDLALDIDDNFVKNKRKMTFYMSNHNDDTFTINPDTDEVEICTMQNQIGNYSNKYYGRISSYTTQANVNHLNGGQLYQGVNIECKKCCQFHYTIQLHINLNISKLTGIFLNSEALYINDVGAFHEIKNVYSTEQTEYSYYKEHDLPKEITLPLIPLNLKNPKETIERLRKLLFFI